MIFIRAGFTLEEVKSTYQIESMDYKYTLDGHIERLKKIHNFNGSSMLARLQKLYSRLPEFVFPDSLPFLRSLNREIYEADLFTLGDSGFQKTKVERSGLANLFDNSFYTQEQKWLSVRKLLTDANEKFIFVDDRGDTIAEVRKRFRKSFCVEINRVNSTDPMEPDKDYGNITVKNFIQLEKYL